MTISLKTRETLLIANARAHIKKSARLTAVRKDDMLEDCKEEHAIDKTDTVPVVLPTENQANSKTNANTNLHLKRADHSSKDDGTNTLESTSSLVNHKFIASELRASGTLAQRMQELKFARDQFMWDEKRNVARSRNSGKGLSMQERKLAQTFTAPDRNFILERIHARQRLIKSGAVSTEILSKRVVDEFITTMSTRSKYTI